jgi:hypothetical protein
LGASNLRIFHEPDWKYETARATDLSLR